jgi:hypothetical protein
VPCAHEIRLSNHADQGFYQRSGCSSRAASVHAWYSGGRVAAILEGVLHDWIDTRLATLDKKIPGAHLIS